MCRANQPVSRCPKLVGSPHQRRNIRLAIRHVHQPCTRQLGGKFGKALVSFDPARALLDASTLAVGILRLARPHPGIQHAQPHAIRTDRVRRMHIHAAPRLIVQRPQAADRLAVEVQLRCVLDTQHDLLLAHTFPCAIPVRLHDVVPFECVVTDKPIRSHRLRPAVAGSGDAPRWLLCESRQQSPGPVVTSLVAQIDARQFFVRPARLPRHLLSPK
ncbi:hypothetical protein R69746_08876 [Paraburkholderia aspalathi]|nr:hypothetical protein R69746_08876 [Paraburkholderia aspalathi]